jgi:Uma2 family endonuclease
MAGERNLAAASDGSIDWPRPAPAERRGLKRATYEDVLSAPENKVAEILDGELFLSPRPSPRHSVASSYLRGALVPFDGQEGPGGWWILFEPELHFGEDVVVPDLGGWRRERLPAIPDTAFFSLAPDWVCEVLSPSTERIDRGRKLRIYAGAGVGTGRCQHVALRAELLD